MTDENRELYDEAKRLADRLKDISPPEGVFDEYYSRVIGPDDVLLEIEMLRETDYEAADLRERLYNYRFYQIKEMGNSFVADRFLAFWVTLLYYERSTSKGKLRQRLALKELRKSLFNDELKMIVDESIYDRLLYEQLYCSARRYIHTCREDKTYTSVIFGLGTLKDNQLKEKIFADLIDGLCFGWKIGLLQEVPAFGKAVIHALLREFPETEESIATRTIKLLKYENADSLVEIMR